MRGARRGSAGGRQTLLDQARQAHGYLAHSWLPFVAPHARLSVLVLGAQPPLSADDHHAALGLTELKQGKARMLVL